VILGSDAIDQAATALNIQLSHDYVTLYARLLEEYSNAPSREKPQVCICACMYVYVYVYTTMSLFMSACLRSTQMPPQERNLRYVCMHACMYVCLIDTIVIRCIHIQVHTHTYVHTCTYTRLIHCTYIHTHKHIYTHTYICRG
jgi:hypothetical protein